MADLRILDAPLLSTVKGTEKIPTGGEGNFSVSVNQVADFAKLKLVLATEEYVNNTVGNVQADLNLHKNNASNPHQVTKTQVGLGNVDNTADLDKPISNATQSAIITANSGKADKSYVDSQDQLKADKVYVDTQDNLKADKNTVEASLLLKADKVDLTASKTSSNGGQTQQDINDFGGARWYAKSGGYELGATVKLENGDIVKSTVANNSTNPNIDMTGWVVASILTLESIAELLTIQNPRDGQSVFVKSYYTATNFALAKPFRGGGVRIYVESQKDINDGGVCINGWVLQFDELYIDHFGARGDNATTDDSVAFANAVNYCAKNHLELHFSDASYLVANEAFVDGDATAFRTVRLRGTFSGTGVNGKYGWWVGRAGTTIITKGNSLLSVWFRRLFNENIAINGVAVINDSATYPETLAPHAVKIIKGDFEGFPDDKRYITGLEFNNFATVGFTAGVLFRGNYKRTQAGNSYLSNYIGNTTFNHFYPYECGSGIVVENATLNRLRAENSMFFSNSLGAIIKREATDLTPAERTEMLIMCQLDMVHFENCRGLFRFFGDVPVGESRNHISMNDVTREFCGLYTESTGSPYGIVENTDITLTGRHDSYGEETLPALGAGSTVTTDMAWQGDVSDGKSLSPTKVNALSATYGLESNGVSLIKSLRANLGFDQKYSIQTRVLINGGELGEFIFWSSGKTQTGNSGRHHAQIGSVAEGITVRVNTASGADLQELIVTNATGSTIIVDYILEQNNSGTLCHII